MLHDIIGTPHITTAKNVVYIVYKDISYSSWEGIAVQLLALLNLAQQFPFLLPRGMKDNTKNR